VLKLSHLCGKLECCAHLPQVYFTANFLLCSFGVSWQCDKRQNYWHTWENICLQCLCSSKGTKTLYQLMCRNDHKFSDELDHTPPMTILAHYCIHMTHRQNNKWQVKQQTQTLSSKNVTLSFWAQAMWYTFGQRGRKQPAVAPDLWQITHSMDAPRLHAESTYISAPFIVS